MVIKNKITVSSSNSLIDRFIIKAKSKKIYFIVASEKAKMYHAVRHNHSYNSLDCSLKLNLKLYQDSKVAAKTSCSQTKSEAIVSNVLGKTALEMVFNDLNHHDQPLYFCLQIDASNHKNMKIFPVYVQYFNKKFGTVNYVVDFFGEC